MPETLYLIDAYAQIFRAYYAIRGGMRSRVTGEPTHAVFGVAGMLLKLFSQFSPHYVAVALDAPGKTFRDELYGEYKATRNATPDDLTAQIPRVLELIEGFGIPVIGEPGLEADDVIATITTRVLNDPALSHVHVRIVSKDKDLEQLLCERVSMFDIHTDTTIDVAALFENKGVTPAQVIDLLALTGDTVDNVPGVEGIGPKTAAQLIQQFGSIDGIYENIEKIAGKRRENLEKARETLPLSRQLVTLRCDGACEFSLETARISPIDLGKLIPLFQQLGFGRYQDDIRKLAEKAGAAAMSAPAVAGIESPAPAGTGSLFDELVSTAPAQTAAAGDYSAVTTKEQLADLARTLQKQSIIAVDTETTGLGRDSLLCGLSFAWEPGHGVYVPIRSPGPDKHLDEQTVLDSLRPVLENPEIAKVGHNIKFDAHALLRHGVRLRGVVFDTLLASTLIDPGQAAHKLDILAERLLNYKMIPLTDLIGTDEQLSINQAPLEKVATYAAEDADIALRLYHVLAPKLEQMGMTALLAEIEAPLAVVLAEMETNGIICDPEELRRQGEILAARVTELRDEIWRLAGCEFQIESTSQLGNILFDKLGFTAGKKTKTGRSTDISVLEKLAADENANDPKSKIPRLVIEYRQLTKLISTYLGNLASSVNPANGRIHTSFHQLMAATGRLASQNPNLQNIPIRTDIGRQIRKAFLAPADHVLICADYSQVELRILAHLCGDEALVQAFVGDQDIHAAVAAQVFGVSPEEVSREQRAKAKVINFGIIYGITPFGLARRIEGLDVAGATELIAQYKQRFPGIDQFLQKCVQEAIEQGYVCTMTGRRRAIPEVMSTNRNHQMLGERLAINSVVQGSAADLIKAAMVKVQHRIDRDRLPMKMLLQIHDELVFESPASLASEHASIVCEEMERAMPLRIPLRAEAGIGADWMSAK